MTVSACAFQQALESPLVTRGFDGTDWPLPRANCYAYLATPYSATEDRGGAARVASWWQRHLALMGHTTVSPVVMGHLMDLPTWGHEEWMRWCGPIMSKAKWFAVPPIAGWDESRGVREEIVWAVETGRRVVLG